MNERRALQLPKRPPNPKTRAAHKKEFRKQVILPLSIFFILLGVASALLIYFEIGTIERWSQIASIALISLSMVIGLVILALLVGLVFLVGQILRQLPPYTRLAQDGIETIKEQVVTGADITVKPVMKIQSFLAVIDALRGRR